MSQHLSPVGEWTTGKRLMALFAGTALAMLLCVALAPAAKAEEASFTFSDGRINLGPDMQGLAIIDSSAGDAPATLTGDVDEEGVFTAPASGFVMPDKTLSGVEASGFVLDIVAKFSAAGPISGTLDQSGDLTLTDLNLTAVLEVYVAPVADPPDPTGALGICQITPIPVPLSTSTDLVSNTESGTITFEGAPFTPDGAASALWESIPGSTVLGGLAPALVCPAIDDTIGGPGGLWLSTTPPPPPPAVPPVSVEAPELTGSEFVGRNLVCNPGSWDGSPNQVRATWTRDGVPFENLANNGKTTKRGYVTQPGDIGSEIACFETGKNPQGTAESDSSNSIVVIDVVPVIEQDPVLTTSNGTGNQVVDVWNLGWQLRGVRGAYSNPTGNPWIGVQRGFAHAALPAPVAIDGTAGNVQYVTQASDDGQSVLFVEVATNIFGETAAFSNETLIAAG